MNLSCSICSSLAGVNGSNALFSDPKALLTSKPGMLNCNLKRFMPILLFYYIPSSLARVSITRSPLGRISRLPRIISWQSRDFTSHSSTSHMACIQPTMAPYIYENCIKCGSKGHRLRDCPLFKPIPSGVHQFILPLADYEPIFIHPRYTAKWSYFPAKTVFRPKPASTTISPSRSEERNESTIDFTFIHPQRYYE